jgi:hypothetical protein
VAKGKKTGGRKKGSLNQANLLVRDIVAKKKCNPFEVLADFCNGDWKSLGYEAEHYFKENESGEVKMNHVISQEMRFHAAKELAKYIAPQLKAVEHSGDGDAGAIVVKIHDYTEKNGS